MENIHVHQSLTKPSTYMELPLSTLDPSPIRMDWTVGLRVNF